MKKIIVSMLVFCMVVSLAGCGSQSASSSELSIADAKKVVLMDGNTGDIVEITDTETIQNITDNFNSLKLQQQGKVDSTGWLYGIKWYDESEKEIANIHCGGEPTSITKDGYVWVIIDGSVNTEMLNNILNQE
jgi:uncharacterized protein YcfL